MNIRKWLGIELIEVSVAEKLIAATGGGLAIFCLFYLTSWAIAIPDSSAIVTSMGASAVLLFAVPHGQLSQPWPAIVGQVISAIIGVTCAKLIPWPTIAAAFAVGLSIGAMHLLKCIHPPGSATALAAVMGGDAIRNLGFAFVFCPVLVNSVMLVLLAILFSLPFKRRRYPASLNPSQYPSKGATQPAHQEILEAIRSLDSFVDISEEDLMYLSTVLSRHDCAGSRKPKTAVFGVVKSG
ncbi:HPP family protein [Schlesneria paludicola]|uniref:HPP family protein n=1 Tax=Schlesneria paludicola TaxID=360056 RepID=UPI0012F7DAD5|nr:HPP family protein [Schlesneria paludicola]